MDRRSFLKSTGSAAAATAAAAPVALEAGAAAAAGAPPAAPAVVKGTREIVLAMAWPDGSSGPADHVLRLARRLEAAMDGRWRIATRSDARGVRGMAMPAEADLHAGSESRNTPLHPAFAYFAGLPGAGTLNPDGVVAWLKAGGGQELWDDLAAEFDVKPFLAGHLGRWPGLWSTAPIDSLADLAGRHIAVEGLAQEVVRGIGAEPVAVSASEIGRALATGDVAAAEYGGPMTSLSLGIPAAAWHLNGFGIIENGTAVSFGMRRTLWDGLTRSEQVIVEAILADANETMLAEQRASEKPLRDLFRQQLGITFRPFPADIAIAVDKVSEAVVADIAGRDAKAARIDHSYHSFRNAAWGIQSVGAASS